MDSSVQEEFGMAPCCSSASFWSPPCGWGYEYEENRPTGTASYL